MPYGYKSERVASSRGRARKLTDRAKQLLAQQIYTTLKATFRDISSLEKSIRGDMGEGGNGGKIQRAMKVWEELRALAEETMQDLREYGEKDKIGEYEGVWARTTADMAILEADAKDHLSLNPPDPEEPVSDDEEIEPKQNPDLQDGEIDQEGTTPPDVKVPLVEHVGELGATSKVAGTEPLSAEPLKREMPSMEDLERLANKFEEEIRALEEMVRANGRLVTREPAVRPALDERGGEHPRAERPGKLEETQIRMNQAMVTTLERISQSLDTRDDQRMLPVAEPEVFTGDPLQFPSWWNSFRVMIESRARSDRDRLHYLCRYTKDVPHRIADSFLSSYNPKAYEEARDIILERFGNPLIVAQAFKDKLQKWQQIREGDGAALQKLSDFLWSCLSALETINYLTDLNSQEENLKIVRKLPKHVALKWTRAVDTALYTRDPETQISKLTGKYPTFRKFCFFISDEARIASSPYYRAVQEAHASTHGQKETKRQQNLATQATVTGSRVQGGESGSGWQRRRDGARTPMTGGPSRTDGPGPTPKCVYCSGAHWVQTCSRFLKKPRAEKQAYADENRMCYGCLRTNHQVKDCRTRNAALMRDPEEALADTAKNMRTTSCDVDHYSMILPVWIAHGENLEDKVLTYAMIDSQSDCSFVTKSLAKKLQLERNPVDLELTTMHTTKVVQSERVTGLQVWGEQETKRLDLRRCYTREKLPGNHENIPDPKEIKKMHHLKKVAKRLRPPRPELEIGVLIGSDCPRAITPQKTAVSEYSDVFGYRSPLGWMVLGPHAERSGEHQQVTSLFTQIRERHVTMENFKEAFDAGFEEERGDHNKMSSEDRLFMKIVTEGTQQRADGHFEVPLPFKKPPEDLPDSYPKAFSRLMGTRKKMLRDEPYAMKYVDFMKKLFSTAQAEPVPQPDKTPKGKRWIWCCHGVENPNKPDVVRGVFDGSAKVDGVCINDLLLQGPDLANNLVGVLCRFREELVPITCDIEGMFHQVFVPEEFRDFLRFLWFKDHDYKKGEVVEYRMCVHLFGATSSPACANFALQETARRHGHKYSPAATELLRDRFYVDDGLGCQPDTDSAATLIRDSHDLCQEGGFNLHKYTSSDTDALKVLDPALVARDMREIVADGQQKPEGRVLGVNLSLEDDEFKYKLKIPVKKPTRRNCLSTLSSVYDPLGFVSPCLLKGRKILQGLCKEGLSWDEQLEDEVTEQWKEWLRELADVESIRVRRCYREKVRLPIAETEVHIFCDASCDSYGACGYLLLKDEQGNADTALLMGKSKVGPTKKTTVPRMELQAAVLGVKLANFLERELTYPNMKFYFWTDSLIVLGWILNVSKRFHVYVENRANFIRTHSDVTKWKHICTENNPADIASRGMTPAELRDSHLWWKGPPEMLDENVKSATTPQVTLSDDPEEKRSHKGSKGDQTTDVSLTLASRAVESSRRTMSLDEALRGIELPEEVRQEVVGKTELREEPWLLTYVRRFSDWTTVVRIIARCIQFSTNSRKPEDKIKMVQAMEEAEELIIRTSQQFYLKKEIALLGEEGRDDSYQGRKDKKKALKNTPVMRLDPFLDTRGCVRVGGRIRRADLPMGARHPILLPKEGVVTKLIVRKYHEATNHMGGNTTLQRIRQGGIWVLQGRRVVQAQVNACVTCKKIRAPLEGQKMSDLPEERLGAAAPFTYSAVDIFGPFQVKVLRSRAKRWICIFVCLACRGIHLEIVHYLTTSSFLEAMRRFVCRRGPMKTLHCDRGTNFIGGKNEMEAAALEIDFERVRTELENQGCEMFDYKFNVPKASHMAGAWERQIRTVRSALAKTIAQEGADLTDESLYTLAVEAECICNSRPLSYLDQLDASSPEPLSPSQLLTLKPHHVRAMPGKFTPHDQYVRSRWRYTQYLSDQFWARYVREVIPEMQQRQKWLVKRPNLEVGDVVLVHDEGAARSDWPMGRVTGVTKSRDGLVRKVEVMMSGKTYERPVHKLVKLLGEGEGCRPRGRDDV